MGACTVCSGTVCLRYEEMHLPGMEVNMLGYLIKAVWVSFRFVRLLSFLYKQRHKTTERSTDLHHLQLLPFYR